MHRLSPTLMALSALVQSSVAFAVSPRFDDELARAEDEPLAELETLPGLVDADQRSLLLVRDHQ